MPIPPKRTGPPRRLVGEDEAAAIPVSFEQAKKSKRAASEGGNSSRIPAPSRPPAAALPNVWMIADKIVTCPHCESQSFQLRQGDTNALICDTCSRIEWFVNEPTFGPAPTPKIPSPR